MEQPQINETRRNSLKENNLSENNLSESNISEINSIMLDTMKTELDLKNKQIKQVKKDINFLTKECDRLQTELKIKNETISSLISQNFSQLNELKSKHDDLINNLSTTYENNLSKLNREYKIFRKSFDKKLKDNLDVQYKFNSEKNALQNHSQKHLLDELTKVKKDLFGREENMDIIKRELGEVIVREEILETKRKELIARNDFLETQLTETKEFLEKQLIENKNFMQTQLYETKNLLETKATEAMGLYQIATDTIVQKEKSIQDLSEININLGNQIETDKLTILRLRSQIIQLETDIEQVKTIYNEINGKYHFILSESINRQNTLDEKNLEIIGLNSKLADLERKINSIESGRKELNMKILELVNEAEQLKIQLLEKQKIINQLYAEKEIFDNEKDRFRTEYESVKNLLRESEIGVVEKIRLIQEKMQAEKEIELTELKDKFKEEKEKLEKVVEDTKAECNGVVSDSQKKMESLTNHIKSFTDNQYVALHEVERIKTVNDKLRLEQANVDQRISEIRSLHKKEMDDLRIFHSKEIDTLMDTYNETIKKSQEMNEALQTRLTQTVEGLSLAKITINQMREDNSKHDKQMQGRDNNYSTINDKYNELKAENLSLREQLDRSVELNNSLSAREKQYEAQMKQLQAKYHHVLSITKKDIL